MRDTKDKNLLEHIDSQTQLIEQMDCDEKEKYLMTIILRLDIIVHHLYKIMGQLDTESEECDETT